jgi:hypothetical protein
MFIVFLILSHVMHMHRNRKLLSKFIIFAVHIQFMYLIRIYLVKIFRNMCLVVE